MSRIRARKTILTVVVASVLGACPLFSQAALAAPIKEVLASRVGWEVDKQTKGKICTTESKHECQFGVESSAPGGFTFPTGVAADNDPSDPAHHDHIYVTDTFNKRVQELTPTGEFVSMFGWDVNRTKQEEAAPQAERDICTAASADTCQVGTPGSAAGQFSRPQSIAVDPSTGAIYVQDFVNYRVEKFTANGEFLLMIGKHVNATTGGNVCTRTEQCQAGEKGSAEHGAFNFETVGGLLAVGGPDKRLYVGDEHRVQEFTPSGEWEDEISLSSISNAGGSTVEALAADENGNVYLMYHSIVKGNEFVRLDTVREFNAAKTETGQLLVRPRAPHYTVLILGLALDQQGRLAVSGLESGSKSYEKPHLGRLYDFATGKIISEFAGGYEQGLSFNDQGELFSANGLTEITGHEVLAHKPVPVAEVITVQPSCHRASPHETDAVFGCALGGEANPEGVSETEAWFDWGRSCSLGSQTAKQLLASGENLAPVTSAALELRPNEAFCYRISAFDHNVQAPESPLTGEAVSFTTPSARPVIVGEPAVSFVKSSSAVLFGEINPENSPTEYAFEYGPCETLTGCATKTKVVDFSTYGATGATFQLTGLQPATRYWYRPVAVNDKQETAEGERGGLLAMGSFTTAPASQPSAVTGPASLIGITSAVISGAVNPDGRAAVYSFEVGIDHGGETQYGTVLSSSTGSGFSTEQEQLLLSGLQPGTTYAYRIRLKSGEGTVVGAPLTFTTQGLPAVLTAPTPLPMLALPNIALPKPTATPKKRTVKPKKHRKGRKSNTGGKRSKARGAKTASGSKLVLDAGT
jgi:hypothetical protein